MTPLRTLSLICTLLAIAPAYAADDFIYGQAGSGASTASLGYGHMFSDMLAGRIGLGRVSGKDYSTDLAGNRYDLKPKAGAEIEAMLDWYPLKDSGLRLSGGLLYRDDAKLSVSGQSSSYMLNGHAYSSTTVGTLQAKADTLLLAPRFELGWESARPDQAGWRYSGNLNLQLDKPRATTLSASGTNAAMQADLAAEQNRFNADLKQTRFHMGIGIGAAYSF